MKGKCRCKIWRLLSILHQCTFFKLIYIMPGCINWFIVYAVWTILVNNSFWTSTLIFHFFLLCCHSFSARHQGMCFFCSVKYIKSTLLLQERELNDLAGNNKPTHTISSYLTLPQCHLVSLLTPPPLSQPCSRFQPCFCYILILQHKIDFKKYCYPYICFLIELILVVL